MPCVLFPEENTPGGLPKLLITKAYSNWKDVINDLKHHVSCAYHRTSITLMENFVKTWENVEARVDYILDKRLKERVAKNRNILESIIRCIKFCGRQGIALRSHRDDETIKKSDVMDKAVFGNLKELLKLCSDLGDTTLKEHLDSCAKNASYTRYIYLKHHKMNSFRVSKHLFKRKTFLKFRNSHMAHSFVSKQTNQRTTAVRNN